MGHARQPLRPLATAGNAYWQPSTALRGAVSVVPFRQSNGPCHREGRPEVAQRALYAPLPAVHSRRRVAMLGRIQPPAAENHAKRRNVLEAPQTPASRSSRRSAGWPCSVGKDSKHPPQMRGSGLWWGLPRSGREPPDAARRTLRRFWACFAFGSGLRSSLGVKRAPSGLGSVLAHPAARSLPLRSEGRHPRRRSSACTSWIATPDARQPVFSRSAGWPCSAVKDAQGARQWSWWRLAAARRHPAAL